MPPGFQLELRGILLYPDRHRRAGLRTARRDPGGSETVLLASERSPELAPGHLSALACL